MPIPPGHLPSCRDFVVIKSAICLVSVRSKRGAVARTLTSHQSDPGSNCGVDAICGLSLLLVLSLSLRGFFPGTLLFLSPQKPTFSNSNSTRNQVHKESLCGCATSKSLFYLFSIIFIRAEFSSRQAPVHWARLCCQLLSVAETLHYRDVWFS